MSVLMYAVGSAAIAGGGLSAILGLLSLITAPAWSRRLSHAARVSPVASPRKRRTAWNGVGIGVGSVLTGTLLVVSVNLPDIGWLAAVAVTALLIWQLGFIVTSRVRHRNAS